MDVVDVDDAIEVVGDNLDNFVVDDKIFREDALLPFTCGPVISPFFKESVILSDAVVVVADVLAGFFLPVNEIMLLVILLVFDVLRN